MFEGVSGFLFMLFLLWVAKGMTHNLREWIRSCANPSYEPVEWDFLEQAPEAPAKAVVMPTPPAIACTCNTQHETHYLDCAIITKRFK